MTVTSPTVGTRQAAATAVVDFQQRRKESSRERLLASALEAFRQSGYFSVSVEDISSAAGVSRMTFYRHFSDKAAIAAELFRQNAEAAMPRFLAIGQRNFRDRRVVADWIACLFAADRASRQLLRVFTQANVDETGFTESAQTLIRDLIVGLGRNISAFEIDPEKPVDRRRWIEAWLLLYEILDQGNHAALGSGVAIDPMVTEILADRFVAFVGMDGMGRSRNLTATDVAG
jgi:AcrR family transcriptional regulator